MKLVTELLAGGLKDDLAPVDIRHGLH